MEDTQIMLQRLFRLYLEDRMSADEYRQFWQLLAAGIEEDSLPVELKALWEQVRSSPEMVPAERWDSRMQGLIRAEAARVPGIQPAAGFQRFRAARWKVAAVWMILAGTAGIGLWLYHRESSSPRVEERIVKNENHPDGHRLVTLSDGSTAILNINSRLDYAPGFGKGKREVYLTGEAYFTIRSLEDQPFIVHSGRIMTRVLGTSFNVKAYPGEKNIAVTVTTGKVQVQNDRSAVVVLTPNQQVVYNQETAQYAQAGIDAQSVVKWKEEDLVFDNVTMQEAARIISDRFQVKVLFGNDRLKKCRVTASFLRQHGLEQVLLVLCKLTDAAYDRSGSTISLSGAGCD